jgi:lipopolysaccharide heptosyltransferase II
MPPMCSDRLRITPAAGRRQRLRTRLLRLFVWLSWPLRVSSARTTGQAISRVWIVRPDHLGDFLLATPALDRWQRAACGELQSTLSVGPWCAELARHAPEVGRLDVFPYPGFTRKTGGRWWAPYVSLVRQARRLRRQRYDLAVILRFDHWWAGLLAYLAGIPRRVGYDTDPLRLFLTERVPYTGIVHEAERNLTLVNHALALAGCAPSEDADEFPSLVYHIRDEDRHAIANLLAGRDVGEHMPLVVIHPGAGAAVKEWPAERFAAVADALIRERGVCVALTGAPADLGTAWRVAASMQEDAHVLAGQTSTGQLAALLERSALVIGSDSGPLHLAVAAGAPSLHLYGPVDPAAFGPWSDTPERHAVLMADCPCAPCNHLDFSPAELSAHRCMDTISVEQVLDAAKAMLAAERS